MVAEIIVCSGVIKQAAFEKTDAARDVELAREQVREQLRQGLLEDQYIEIEVSAQPKGNQLDMSNEGMSIAIGNIFGADMPQKTRKKKPAVAPAAAKLLFFLFSFYLNYFPTAALTNCLFSLSLATASCLVTPKRIITIAILQLLSHCAKAAPASS
mgnify:CR=1 FL=1